MSTTPPPAASTTAAAAAATATPTPAATAFVPPPKPPPPTTISGKIRARLPGRGWMIFWATIGTLGGLVTRDHYLTVDARKRVTDKVDVLAKTTCGVQDMPRKVTVYITAPPGDGIHKTRHYFKAFVKPIFDAAALDYEVKEGLAEGQIQAMVAADIRKKRQLAAGKITEEAPALPIVSLKSYSDGVVVLGRIALAEVLQGYSDGCLQSLDDPEPIVAEKVEVPELTSAEIEKSLETKSVEAAATAAAAGSSSSSTTESSSESTESAASTTEPSSSPSTTAEEKKDDTKKEEEKKETPPPVVIPKDEAYFSLPATGLEPVGYIPFKNLVGFRNFHKKAVALFNSYDCVEYAGNAVMKVAFAETKDMTTSDLEIGRDEEPLFVKYRGPVEIDMHDRVREQTKIFVMPEVLPTIKVVEEPEENVFAVTADEEEK